MMTLPELCAPLLLPQEHLTLQTLIVGEHGITFVARMTSSKATCPGCHHLASYTHSAYPRTLAALPWATRSIALRFTVRRFFCTTCTCPRQTFTERLQTVAPLYAWTTPRVRHAQATPGLALGGAAGARQLLAQFQAQEGEVAEATSLTQAFVTLVRQRQSTHLDAWLERAVTSTMQAFVRLAKSLRDDYAAVKAGVTLPWSTGPVEGQINRLKMLKRQIFGQANMDLLRLRVLYRA